MYNIEQLRMFVICAKLGTFSACAKKLGKVQSAVSQGIANLEIDLNVQLFDRTTRKPTLTAEGQHLLFFAEATLQQMHEFECASKALSHKEESKLSLVLDDGLQLERFYSIMDQFSSQFPATSLDTFFAASSDVVNLISNDQADIGLMYSDMTFIKDVELCYIGNIPFVAVVSPNHPLTVHSTVFASQLLAQRQLMIKGLYNNQFQFQPLSPLVWWANDYRMLRHYVEKGIGWSYLPKHMVEKDLESGLLHALPLSFDHKPWSIPVERVTPKNRTMGPACTWLAQMLTTVLE
jgi:DNA-binding transcriptional LysR family regulator